MRGSCQVVPGRGVVTTVAFDLCLSFVTKPAHDSHEQFVVAAFVFKYMEGSH